MKKIHRSALLTHSAMNMYLLVNDVEQYAHFLPWCEQAEVLSCSDTELEARLTIRRAGMSGAFVTHNCMAPGERIEMQLKEGPFHYLRGAWEFRALTDRACKVCLELTFDMPPGLLKGAVERLLEQSANGLFDAFCSRADHVYGRS